MIKTNITYFALLATIIAVAIVAGCVGDDSSFTLNGAPDTDITTVTVSADNETLRICAFNIQVFGKSKAAKGEVMDVLADIIRTFDIVAIQEIRDKDQTALPKLVNLVNSKGTHYDYVVGPRLGRSSSKEQYAYIYNNRTVNLNGTPWTYPEPNGTDPFHREPYVAYFKAVVALMLC